MWHQPVHSEDQPWDFFGRNDAKAETPVLWPPHAKSWLIGKDSDAGRDWGREEKGTTEDEMAGWHHRLDGHESEWTLRVGDGQGGLACYDSWGHKESDTTERLNWTEDYALPIHLDRLKFHRSLNFMKPIFHPRRNILEVLPLVVYKNNCKQFIIRLDVCFLLKLYENYLHTLVLRTDT